MTPRWFLCRQNWFGMYRNFSGRPARSRASRPVEAKGGPDGLIVQTKVAPHADPKEFRRQGISVKLIEAAVAFASKHGAMVVEAYPVEPYSEAMPAAFAWTGLAKSFLDAGFVEVERRSNARPIMRKECGKKRRTVTKR